MGIFSNLLGKIFGHKPKAAPAPASAPKAQPTPLPQTPQEQAHAQAPDPVDIEAVLEDMAANNPQNLNWRTSIVDLMKLVGMEGGLQERKELAENGGKAPASLMD